MLYSLLLAVVVGVSDGDTITALTHDRQQMKVRLAGIDAPEKKQAFGQRSKQNLSNLVYGKSVDLQCTKLDRYQRHLCTVMADGRDVNLQQIRDGMAWHYKLYAKEQSPADALNYSKFESIARDDHVGLWSHRSPLPPWEWRKLKGRKNVQESATLNRN